MTRQTPCDACGMSMDGPCSHPKCPKRGSPEQRLRARLDRMNIATAIKERGAEWYHPAVKTPMGPKRLRHGERQSTRYQAIKEAERVLFEGDET